MSPKQFKLVRQYLNLSQEELAEALGLSRMSISQYETGFRKPGSTVLVLMYVFEALPKRKALELFQLLCSSARNVDHKPKRLKT